MDRKIIEKDFGGIVKYSIFGNTIYVDPRFMLELKCRRITLDFVNVISDILQDNPDLLEFFNTNKEHLSNTNFFDVLNEVPITSIKRVLELAKQVEDEEQEDIKITH